MTSSRDANNDAEREMQGSPQGGSNAPVSASPATRRLPCPDCPDGYVWTATGPTDKACPTCGGNAYIEKPAVTMFMCGPSKCDHDYSGWQPIMVNGQERGGTAACTKCGRTAFEEAAWL